MKNLRIISATEARNNWFEILNWVNQERKEVWIKKNKKIAVKLSPGDPPNIDNIEDVIKRTRGMFKGKKTYFPYQDDKKVIERERKYLTNVRLWKIK